jgi:hypothetical protein|tara:strand:+ start:151 stop:363 length:213 start_codon:yes stop_codon:yes gene_type:complete
MNELEIKNLIVIYQRKLSDFLSQSIAMEAKVLTLTQQVESLTSKLTEQENELVKLRKPKRTTKNIDSEGF